MFNVGLLLIIVVCCVCQTFCDKSKIADGDHLNLATNVEKKQMAQPKENELVRLECPVERLFEERKIQNKSQYYLINWFKDEKKLNKFNRRVIAANDYLTIRSVNKFDEGVYFCEIITGTGLNLKSPNLTIQLRKNNAPLPQLDSISKSNEEWQIEKQDEDDDYDSGESPIFLDEMDEDNVMYRFESSAVELNCLAYGKPKLQVLWYKNGNIISEEDLGIVRDSMSLKLNELYLSDSGLYTCKVSNKYGQLNRNFHLQVTEKDVINTTTHKGGMVILECPLSRNHTTSTRDIKWFVLVENQSLQDYSRVLSRIDLDIEVYIELVLEKLDYPPHFDSNLMLNIDYQSKILDLSILISTKRPHTRILQLNDGSILFQNVSLTNAGFYMCQATPSKQISRRIKMSIQQQQLADIRANQWDDGFESLKNSPLLICIAILIPALFICILLRCCYRSYMKSKYIKPENHLNLANRSTLSNNNNKALNRSTTSPKPPNYEYFNRRQYWPSGTALNSNYSTVLNPRVQYVSEINYMDGRRMNNNNNNNHMGIYDIQQSNRVFISSRSIGTHSRPCSTSDSKCCSRISAI